MFTFDEAVENVVDFLYLRPVVYADKNASPEEKKKAATMLEEVKARVKWANEGDNKAKVSRDTFEQALRETTDLVDEDSKTTPKAKLFNIDSATLMQALVRSLLQGQNINIAIDADPTLNTPQRYLERLRYKAIINAEQRKYVLWYVITGLSTPRIKELLEENKNMAAAVRAGLHVGALSMGTAKVAEFCLITGLGPGDVRKQDARKDLVAVVKKAVAPDNMPHLGDDDRLAKIIRAELFPFEHDENVIKEALDDPDRSPADARVAYMVAIFKKETSCTDDAEAMTCLEDSQWHMQDAVRKQYDKYLTLPAMATVPNEDTANPPDIRPDTMVVGLLGTVDRSDPDFTASPAVDGWMVSDFYLMKHLLKGMGKSQVWISATSVKPEGLVKRYASKRKDAIIGVKTEENDEEHPISWDTGYLHGSKHGTRKVVLDSDPDSVAFANKDAKFFDEKVLLSNYLATVEATFRDAKASGSHVALLMFSHGDIDNFGNRGGLEIGFRGCDPHSKDDYLTTEMIETLHKKYPTVRLTLFMTSCYSGHWVATPYFLAQPNITVMAAAQKDEKSYSWESSASMRHGGGKFTTGFKEELAKEPTSQKDAADAREYQLAMEDLADRCSGMISKKFGGSMPAFTYDVDHERFFRRTGYALWAYEDNWKALKDGPPPEPKSKYEKEEDAAQFASRTASYGRTDRGLPQSLEYLTLQYLESNPTTTSNDNMLKNQIGLFRAGQMHKKESLRNLWAQITFRNAQCVEAAKLVKELRLYKGAAIRIQDWDGMTLPSDLPEDYRTRRNHLVYRLKTETGLFKPVQSCDHGLLYEKPFLFVAHAMYLHQKTDGEITGLIRTIKDLAKAEFKTGSKRVLSEKSANETIQAMLLQRSPKKQRASLAGVFESHADQENL